MGSADDTLDADGVDVLDWAQAQAKARAWFEAEIRKAAGGAAPVSGYTVAQAAADYLAWYETERKGLREARSQINAHIVPKLGKLPLAKLTTDQIRGWHRGMAEAPRLVKGARGQAARPVDDGPEGEDAIRKRRSRANRVLNTLKALLNRAVEEGKTVDTGAWRKVKPFRNVDAARDRFPTVEEGVALVRNADADFAPLIQGALHTGARYGELIRLKVRDFSAGKIRVGDSKGGKGRWIRLTAEGRAFFAALTEGRAKNDVMFKRADGAAWKASQQDRRMEAACARAEIALPITFHELRHGYASLAIMGGMSLVLLAENLGHTDTRMVEKHYGHLLDDYRDEMIERHAPRFGFGGNNT